MARIEIVIEDDELTGKVKMQVTPNFEKMVEMLQSGHGLTSAHGYAIRCINTVREASKEQKSDLLVNLPGIKV